jgi:hypothetical protein
MKLRPLMTAGAGALLLSTARCYPSPCSKEIVQLQGQIDSRLDSLARGGPAANESASATLHRQPTPASIASAEVTIGDLSPETLEALSAAMLRARKAEGSRDEVGCERAVGEAHRVMGD